MLKEPASVGTRSGVVWALPWETWAKPWGTLSSFYSHSSSKVESHFGDQMQCSNIGVSSVSVPPPRPLALAKLIASIYRG